MAIDRYVLDTSALIALIENEAGGSRRSSSTFTHAVAAVWLYQLKESSVAYGERPLTVPQSDFVEPELLLHVSKTILTKAY